ncbi:MAG: type II toxin-antitoxin system VapC family toxin [Acidobacteriia bacterium]|nr:type II toxin-antitoxin system VapC family toxin [Terriglobia bacterium]
MTLLLDTHTLIWWLEGNRKLGRRARGAIESAGAVVWVSAASAWEIAIKVALGRLDLSEPPEVCLPREMSRSRFQPLAVSLDHALAVRALPPFHADPFDRMLIAQAEAEGLTVVTGDAVFERYGIQVLDARQ